MRAEPLPSRGTGARAAAGRDALKRTVRRVGVLTAGFRPAPDFLVIGAKRGGTTSFYFDLLAHPSVLRLFPPPVPGLKGVATKGVHYFDSNFHRGEPWYRSHFPTAAARRAAAARTGGRVVSGEASPYYLFHPDAAERAFRSTPDSRIIVLLRDPVLRTYSHWKERRRGGAEPLDFAAALAAEPGRLAGERDRLLADPAGTSYAWEQQSYATQSEYAAALRPWIERFGRERVCAVVSEEYYADPAAILAGVHDFLGIPRRERASGSVRNAAPAPELPATMRADLRSRFADSTAELTDLLGREFPW